MGSAIGQVLEFGVGVALSPLAVAAVVIMLVSGRGARTALIFVATWALSLALVSSLTLVIADAADPSSNGGPATWVSISKVVVALLLVAFAIRQGRRPTATDPGADAPAWTRKLDDLGGARAAGLAVLFTMVKPKNLLLAIGAGLAVAQVGADAPGQVPAIAVFALLGSAGVVAPPAIRVAMPRRGPDLLIASRDRMMRHNGSIVAVLSLVIAAKLVGDAVVAFTS